MASHALVPPTAPPARREPAELRAFRRAAAAAPGYRAFLEGAGVDPSGVSALAEVPYTDKRTVFTLGVGDWLGDAKISDAVELLTSSGQSGHFSVGFTSRQERHDAEEAIDQTLRMLGAGPDSSTLVLNCLPMGIGVNTSIATVATPSVHLEMALEMLTRLGPSFDRTVITAEPLFLKELGEVALRELGPGFAPNLAACFIGGEWVAESLRAHLAELLGLAGNPEQPGILVSMGAAELGLHAFFETPELRAARAALAHAPGEVREALFGSDPGYTPSLFAYNPERLYVEERIHPGGERTLVCTTLRERLLPLVRYDLDDLGQIVPAETINRELERIGFPVRLSHPVVAVWGRRGAEARGPGWRLRPELIKERLFSSITLVGALTGRFLIQSEGGAPMLHVQLREGERSNVWLERALERLVEEAAGTRGRVRAHTLGSFPFHAAGDFQHKPRYLAPAPLAAAA